MVKFANHRRCKRWLLMAILLSTGSLICLAADSLTSSYSFNQDQSLTLSQVGHLYAIDFLDSLTGWFVGAAGTVIHTSNGGKTWEMRNIGRIDVSLLAVDFINIRKGWVAGSLPGAKGIILNTEDGGKSWHVQYEEDRGDFYVIRFINEKHGWVGGQRTGILYTTDGGKIWRRGQPELPHAFVLSISFLDTISRTSRNQKG
jgi:photosystem II stability/assembly factor-like uncharacterized protein